MQPSTKTDPHRAPISIWAGAAFGALWTLALVAVAALAEVITGFPNPAYRVFEALAGVLPGELVTFGIEVMIRTVHSIAAESTAAAAKTAEKAMAVTLATTGGAVAGVIVAALARRWAWRPALIGAIVGAVGAMLYGLLVPRIGGGFMLLASLFWFLALGVLIGESIAITSRQRVGEAESGIRRRRVLGILASAVGIGALALGFSRLLRRSHRPAAVDVKPGQTGGPAASPPESTLAARVGPVPGTRPEITANEDFYRVDINLTPPAIDASEWRLEIDGLVARPQSLTIDELRRRPATSQIITLECISNPVGGDLISTSRWTGVRLIDLLQDLEVDDAARAVVFEAADGFHESATLEDLADPRALLVYEMNGEPLPRKHGFPLRLYIPNRHGMKLPKWILRMEVVERPRPGYWVQRGWSEDAIPHTTSVIDTIRATGSGDGRRLSIGGIAYAGARGISKVEVQLDGGEWRPARLRAPALGPLTWMQWRYDVPYRPGEVTVRVRAYDGSGALQQANPRPPHPSGATGIHVKKTRV